MLLYVQEELTYLEKSGFLNNAVASRQGEVLCSNNLKSFFNIQLFYSKPVVVHNGKCPSYLVEYGSNGQGCQSCSWSAKQEEYIFPCPRSRLRIWFRETGSAVPSRVRLLILHTQAESGA